MSDTPPSNKGKLAKTKGWSDALVPETKELVHQAGFGVLTESLPERWSPKGFGAGSCGALVGNDPHIAHC